MHHLGGGLAPSWWYTRIFLGDIEADTLNCAFNIPLDGPCSEDINYGLNKFDMVMVDEALMISCTFDVMVDTFNQLNMRAVVAFAGKRFKWTNNNNWIRLSCDMENYSDLQGVFVQ